MDIADRLAKKTEEVKRDFGAKGQYTRKEQEAAAELTRFLEQQKAKEAARVRAMEADAAGVQAKKETLVRQQGDLQKIQTLIEQQSDPRERSRLEAIAKARELAIQELKKQLAA
jgi:hypothetical protein